MSGVPHSQNRIYDACLLLMWLLRNIHFVRYAYVCKHPTHIFQNDTLLRIYYKSQLFTVRGNGITSLMLPIPVIYITQRSKPSPKPAWRAEP